MALQADGFLTFALLGWQGAQHSMNQVITQQQATIDRQNDDLRLLQVAIIEGFLNQGGKFSIGELIEVARKKMPALGDMLMAGAQLDELGEDARAGLAVASIVARQLASTPKEEAANE